MKCVFLHLGKSLQPNRKSKKQNWKAVKVSIAMVRNEEKLCCVSQDIDALPAKSVRSITEQGRKILVNQSLIADFLQPQNIP